MDTNRSVSDTNTRQSIRVPILIAGVVFALWLLIGFGPRLFFNDWDSSGTFGDTFGSANALFSGLAFAGVIWAIVLQRKELQLQGEQLARSVQAQEESQRELRRQADSADKLTRLNGLNALLGLYEERVDRLGGASKGTPEYEQRMSYRRKQEECRRAIERFHEELVGNELES